MIAESGPKTVWLLLLVALVATAIAGGTARAAGEAMDWERARALLEKENGHQPLTAEQQAYLARAREARRKMTNAPGPPKKSWGLTPLTEMGEAKYKGETGGLYGGGSNVPSPALREAAAKAAARVRPLDAEGRPSPAGKIVLISIGMSNTSMEFSTFQQVAAADQAMSPGLLIVNGSQGGRDAAAWVRVPETEDPQRPSPWIVLDQRLKEAGVTGRQVQVAWIKQALAGPARIGEFPAHARKLQADLVTILNMARQRYPNLQLAYLSNRTYAGYATTNLNPEPYAYESAFAVRWIIQGQAAGNERLNADPARGEIRAPVVLWGPYLWTAGTTPRKSDGLVWKPEDCGQDGTHPSNSGRRKVAALLLEFFKNDFSAAPWFAPTPPAPAAD